MPGSVVGPPPPLDPPPQPKAPAVNRATHINPNANFNRRRLAGMLKKSKQHNRVPPPNMNHASGLNTLPTVCGPVVVTVRTVVPELVTEVGARAQAASLIVVGTAQEKVTLPVNPLAGLTVRVVLPDWPGLAMLKLVGLAVKVKSGGGAETVIVVVALGEAP